MRRAQLLRSKDLDSDSGSILPFIFFFGSLMLGMSLDLSAIL